MLRKGIGGFAAAAFMFSTTLAAPAMATTGVVRNQAALGVAGHMTPAMQTCAQPTNSPLRAQCPMSQESSDFLGHHHHEDFGVYIVALGALAAIILGILAATHGQGHGGYTPPPAPVSS